MTEKYHPSQTPAHDEALFEHGPHVANLLMKAMKPTKMTSTQLLFRYIDEPNPRENESLTEWALIHFGYLSLCNAENPLAAQEQLLGHIVESYMPEFTSGEDLERILDAHPRVDGRATDEDLLGMDIDNVAIIGLDSLVVSGIKEFCSTMAHVRTPGQNN